MTEQTISSALHRPIRSFVRREGRVTPAQRRALADLFPHYGIDPGDVVFDFAQLFGRQAPVVLEIGFGNGQALAAMAGEHPENDYLGIEVHRPGVGQLLLRVAEQGLQNVRVIATDAKQVLERNIAPASLDSVHLFFPDPWPKKRHHKRRLVQPDFVQLVRTRLKSGGRLHLATDWQDYAEHMMQVLSQAPGFENLVGPGEYAPRAHGARPLTKFEQRGQRLGHGVWDLLFQRTSAD